MFVVSQYLQNNPVFFYSTLTILSLMIGSFLNVVILRLPVMLRRLWRKECEEFLEEEPAQETEPQPFNLVVPRSRCPECRATVLAIDNIPVLSFLLLRGRCRKCRTPISLRYPCVEAVTALASLYVAWRFGVSMHALCALFLTWCLICLAVIDWDSFLLPDHITLPLLWAGLLVNLTGTFTSISSAVLGAVFGYLLLYFACAGFKLLTGKQGMGNGDFKLLAALGAWLGWEMLPLIVLLSSISGSVFGIAQILMKKQERSVPIPFGPWLVLAGWISMLHGEGLMRMWIR